MQWRFVVLASGNTVPEVVHSLSSRLADYGTSGMALALLALQSCSPQSTPEIASLRRSSKCIAVSFDSSSQLGQGRETVLIACDLEVRRGFCDE